MIQYLIRPIKRFAVLVPGVIIAYFSVRNIFPYFNQRLPLAFAILLTYALGAYVLVPAIIRAWRILVPAKHLPLYCVTPDGFASDPVNVGIVGTRRELINAMHDSGWHMADPHHWRYLVRHVLSTAFNWDYPNAPVSNLYLFGRKHDLAFQIPLGNGHRHHIRFWATTFEEDKPFSFRSIHWHHRKAHVYGDTLLWVGAASLDAGFGFIRHNLQVTHMINPDTDAERELIVKQLSEQKLSKKTETITLGQPYKLVNRVFSGFLHTDGKMTIVTLKKRSPK